jgi:nicotinamidase-related amidase
MSIVLVMNAQNSFLKSSGSVYIGQKAEVLKIRMKDYLSSFSGKKYFCKEIHSISDNFFLGEKTHSVPSTPDVEIIDELKPFVNFVVEKYRYDAFYKTPLEAYLNVEKPDVVYIIGVETHTSVMFTAEELRNRGQNVRVVEPLLMSRDDCMHSFGISVMRNCLGVEVE